MEQNNTAQKAADVSLTDYMKLTPIQRIERRLEQLIVSAEHRGRCKVETKWFTGNNSLIEMWDQNVSAAKESTLGLIAQELKRAAEDEALHCILSEMPARQYGKAEIDELNRAETQRAFGRPHEL